jgi:hypothetical protein
MNANMPRVRLNDMSKPKHEAQKKLLTCDTSCLIDPRQADPHWADGSGYDGWRAAGFSNPPPQLSVPDQYSPIVPFESSPGAAAAGLPGRAPEDRRRVIADTPSDGRKGDFGDQAEGGDHDPGSASTGPDGVGNFQRDGHRPQDGAHYKENPDLGKPYQEIRRGLELFKYLRNVYVGHFVPDLTNKTFEWIPFTNALLGGEKQNERFGVSWFALETTVNTYTDPNTGHKFFHSDTDLDYPPDHTLFPKFLENTALSSMDYVTQLVSAARTHLDVLDVQAEMLQLAFAAGQTDFLF